MPELPEVEVTRRSLAARVLGARVRGVRLGKALRWPLGCDPQSLLGATVGALQRRGKYLWMPLQRDAMCGGLLWHLGMSGSLGLRDTWAPPGPHDHFELETDHGTLRLTDPRRFGAVVWSDALDHPPAATLLARLGAEPFDPAFTPEAFHQALHRRHCPIKVALLGGQVVVGAGNIYVSEALFDAGIDPRARCDRLSRPRSERLLAALRATLTRAIELGGSTLRDFRDGHGDRGVYQQRMAVYGREGQPCRRCGTPIRRIVQGQRASYYCPACQRR